MTAIEKKIREVRLTNSATHKKEILKPLVAGKISFYSCGPTVYNLIHIGNLRSGVVSDLFFRYFVSLGYDTTFVRNYTDVDDKIIRQAEVEGLTPEQVATKYTIEVERDFALAGMLEPTHKTTVTTHMVEIIDLISQIIARGHAYVASDGEVLFSIKSFSTYGKLSRKNLDELEAGIRVEVSEKKRDPLDFTLWKPAKKGEPSWSSPWGQGRPGWHIECSAMARKWLGDQMDIHHGGPDLIFPHHENEIAQSEAGTGHAPFVGLWLHHAFVTLSKEKMSKSLGNVFGAREFLTRFGGELARYFLLSVHYRSPIDFDSEALENALTSLTRLYEAKLKAKKLLEGESTTVSSDWSEFVKLCDQSVIEIEDHFANDMNTPGALSVVFTLVRNFNRMVGEPLLGSPKAASGGARRFLGVLKDTLGPVMGFGLLDPEVALLNFERIRKTELVQNKSAALMSDDEIRQKIADRKAAREAKNFAEADRIRKDLEVNRIFIKDGPAGTTWEIR